MAFNILFIVMDATRAGNLSCYGYHRPTSPHLDHLAQEGVLYDQAISPAGWSLPGHASMFTGLYPSRHGACEQHKYLDAGYTTMAERLQSHGYRTMTFCYNEYVGAATGLNRGFQQFNRTSERGPAVFRKLVRKLDGGVAMLQGMRDSGARFTNRQVYHALDRARREPEPFFMFAHYEEPHAPYRPPLRYNRYLPAGVSPAQAQEVNQDQWKYMAGLIEMGERDFEILKALYDAEITYLDMRIGQVLNWLREWRILDQTMVIVTADHGENLGEHEMLGHQYCLYDTLLHVPLIIHYPKGIAQAGRVGHQVQTLDLLPTILAMLGDPAADSLQGLDLLSSHRREFTVAEWSRPNLTGFYKRHPGVDVSRYDRELRMIRTPDWKYIWSSNGAHELYNLPADPGELHNVLSERADVAADLQGRLSDWQASFTPAQPAEEAPEFDETVKSRLRALGYLE